MPRPFSKASVWLLAARKEGRTVSVREACFEEHGVTYTVGELLNNCYPRVDSVVGLARMRLVRDALDSLKRRGLIRDDSSPSRSATASRTFLTHSAGVELNPNAVHIFPKEARETIPAVTRHGIPAEGLPVEPTVMPTPDIEPATRAVASGQPWKLGGVIEALLGTCNLDDPDNIDATAALVIATLDMAPTDVVATDRLGKARDALFNGTGMTLAGIMARTALGESTYSGSTTVSSNTMVSKALGDTIPSGSALRTTISRVANKVLLLRRERKHMFESLDSDAAGEMPVDTAALRQPQVNGPLTVGRGTSMPATVDMLLGDAENATVTTAAGAAALSAERVSNPAFIRHFETQLLNTGVMTGKLLMNIVAFMRKDIGPRPYASKIQEHMFGEDPDSGETPRMLHAAWTNLMANLLGGNPDEIFSSSHWDSSPNGAILLALAAYVARSKEPLPDSLALSRIAVLCGFIGRGLIRPSSWLVSATVGWVLLRATLRERQAGSIAKASTLAVHLGAAVSTRGTTIFESLVPIMPNKHRVTEALRSEDYRDAWELRVSKILDWHYRRVIPKQVAEDVRAVVWEQLECRVEEGTLHELLREGGRAAHPMELLRDGAPGEPGPTLNDIVMAIPDGGDMPVVDIRCELQDGNGETLPVKSLRWAALRAITLPTEPDQARCSTIEVLAPVLSGSRAAWVGFIGPKGSISKRAMGTAYQECKDRCGIWRTPIPSIGTTMKVLVGVSGAANATKRMLAISAALRAGRVSCGSADTDALGSPHSPLAFLPRWREGDILAGAEVLAGVLPVTVEDRAASVDEAIVLLLCPAQWKSANDLSLYGIDAASSDAAAVRILQRSSNLMVSAMREIWGEEPLDLEPVELPTVEALPPAAEMPEVAELRGAWTKFVRERIEAIAQKHLAGVLTAAASWDALGMNIDRFTPRAFEHIESFTATHALSEITTGCIRGAARRTRLDLPATDESDGPRPLEARGKFLIHASRTLLPAPLSSFPSSFTSLLAQSIVSACVQVTTRECIREASVTSFLQAVALHPEPDRVDGAQSVMRAVAADSAQRLLSWVLRAHDSWRWFRVINRTSGRRPAVLERTELVDASLGVATPIMLMELLPTPTIKVMRVEDILVSHLVALCTRTPTAAICRIADPIAPRLAVVSWGSESVEALLRGAGSVTRMPPSVRCFAPVLRAMMTASDNVQLAIQQAIETHARGAAVVLEPDRPVALPDVVEREAEGADVDTEALYNEIQDYARAIQIYLNGGPEPVGTLAESAYATAAEALAVLNIGALAASSRPLQHPVGTVDIGRVVRHRLGELRERVKPEGLDILLDGNFWSLPCDDEEFWKVIALSEDIHMVPRGERRICGGSCMYAFVIMQTVKSGDLDHSVLQPLRRMLGK
jgi:hypothetical protein